MAAAAVRALLAAAALASLAGARAGAGAARFGDRLTPRVPAARARAAYGPRHSPAAYHVADSDYDDYEPEYAEISNPEEEAEATHPDTAPPAPPAPSHRSARTEAHRLEMSTEYFVVPDRVSSTSTTQTPAHAVTTPRSTNTTIIITQTPIPHGALRSESWAVPILALACVSMVTLGGFEVFVVWGANKKSPSQRHLLLGQTLLFGLFSCAATAALYAATPTVFTCGAVRFGAGVSYVVVFASLLVKCVFLLSLNGGVYLPAAYQGLLLFFAVMIQVAIGAQWLGGSPPKVAPVGGRCDTALSDLLLSLSYAAFLIMVVCAVALRSRAIRDNYREATHIAGAGGAAAAVWVCWVAAALGAPDPHRDACVAAGLLATCAVVFALMFAPKGRRLAALGREGRWDADRDEGLSSLGGGAGGSGYSPSFFHFKPVKYGMVSATSALPVPLAAPPLPPALDRKDPPAQPADPYGPLFGSSLHSHPRPPRSPPPPHYPPHPFMHYYYNYPSYHYFMPPGVVVRPRPEEGHVYTSVEPTPTFSTNPNVYFQRPDPLQLHVGMMY